MLGDAVTGFMRYDHKCRIASMFQLRQDGKDRSISSSSDRRIDVTALDEADKIK